MCIITIKPAGNNISEDNLYNMWVNNPHGAGMMYARDGKLHVLKGLMTYSQFIKAYRNVRDEKLVIHFRWRTHGPMLKKLTHPFYVKNNVGMVHNGVIPFLNVKRHESDTSTYARMLQDRFQDPMKDLENISNRLDIMFEIGLSKLVFMAGDGNIFVLNGHMGHWGDDGCWYSNHSYNDHKTYDAKYGKIDYDPENWTISPKMIKF